MSDQIQVHFGDLSTGATDITAGAARLNQRLDDLKAYINQYTASWEGEAKTHYDARQREWDTAAADLNAILHKVGQAVGITNDDFVANEHKLAGMWGGR